MKWLLFVGIIQINTYTIFSQSTKQNPSETSEILSSKREDRVLSLFKDWTQDYEDAGSSPRYFQHNSHQANNFNAEDINSLLRLMNDGDEKAFNLGIQGSGLLNPDSRTPYTLALLGNIAVFLTSLYLIQGASEEKAESLIQSLSSGKDSIFKLITTGELPDLEDMKLPEGLKLPENLKLLEDMKLPEGFKMPSNLKLPSSLQKMWDNLTNLSRQNLVKKPSKSKKPKPASFKKLPTLPPVIIIPPIHSAGKTPFYQFPINDGKDPKTVFDYMTGFKYKIPTNAISLGYNTPPPNGYKPASNLPPLEPHKDTDFPGVLPAVKHHGLPVHAPHHIPVLPPSPLHVIPEHPLTGPSGGAKPLPEPHHPKHQMFQHFPASTSDNHIDDQYPFLKDPTPHPVGSLKLKPAITLDSDFPHFVDLTGGNPTYESFFLKTAGPSPTNTANTNDEIEEEINNEEGALDSKTSEERNVENFTDMPHLDEEQINQMLETADPGQIIDLTDDTETDTKPSINFMKGKNLYEKFKMKKNKKYLYKLLEAQAMTTSTTSKPGHSSQMNHRGNSMKTAMEMDMKKHVETSIENTNSVLDRYDSAYMDEILKMSGFESIKLPGAYFGKNSFTRSQLRNGGSMELEDEEDMTTTTRNNILLDTTTLGRNNNEETTTQLDTLVITL